MKADFSGYATKVGLKCSDGRTIMQDAFKHQDKQRVPLVWQHGHSDPENVLGHVLLEHRDDGVYAYGFFNDSPKAQHIKTALQHRDINMLSIWANNLVERNLNVFHGAIREVSLVLSGANPGALIDNITIRHSDGEVTVIEDEAYIYTGLEISLEHSDLESDESDDTLEHAEDGEDDEGEETLQDVYDSMTDKQKEVVHYMIGGILETKAEASADEKTDEDTSLAQSNLDDNTNDPEGTNEMKHNAFEQNGTKEAAVLSHAQVMEIVETAKKSNGSLRDAVDNYALAHGIENIDQMFPDAHAVDAVPEWLKRRTEWVDQLLSATKKSPFARIKTLMADITEDEARAKGYIKGSLKREEFFTVSKRVTTPQTIYKKQKLDRDDMIDITDFDVVAWLKGEMRLMLDEELARAILIGDGRDVNSEDKIQEANIRPIATDHELYTTVVNVNIDDSNSSVEEVLDAIILNRSKYKGTGAPDFFTTETLIAKFLVVKDTTGRRIYKTLDEVANAMRVRQIIPVEVMEEVPDILGIMVNPVDYTIGADKGGQVTMFDDFDIDYNQNKYLIETRVCGALTKLKSAIVVKKVAGTAALVVPVAPAFNQVSGVVTIPTVTGVSYRTSTAPTVGLTAGAMTAIAAGASVTIVAVPSSASYYFGSSDNDSWTFTRDEA